MNEVDLVAESPSGLFEALVSSGQTGPDSLILLLIVACGLMLIAVHGSIAIRLLRIGSLARNISALYESRTTSGRDGLLRDLDRIFASSLLADSWSELMRRRRELKAHAPEDHAAVRMKDLLVDRPLIPLGVRRRAMKVLPGFFAALGLSATLASLAASLTTGAAGDPIAPAIGLALRGAFWGVALGALAETWTVLLEGTAEAQASRLSLLIERSYHSLTPIEAQMRSDEAQRLGFERVSSLLVQVAEDLRDALDRGLGRIERSTASAANLVGEEQRRMLELVIQDLSSLLRRGVEEQVGALRTSLELAADQQATLGDRVVSTIDRMNAGAEGNLRVSGALERAAQAVDEAAGTVAGSAGELKPLIVHLGEVAATLERASARVETAQSLTHPADEPSVSMLRALRDDVALIGAQFLEGATALQRSVEPFRNRTSETGERDVAQALEDFDQRAGALRDRLEGDAPVADRDEAPRETPQSVEIAAAPEPAPIEPAPSVAEATIPEAAARPVRRGGDLASALARSGEALEATPEHAEDIGAGAASPVTAIEPVEETSADEITEGDLQAVGRGGFSALLSRYKAPQFSIDELPPDLREFNADDAERRARAAHEGDAGDQREPAEPGRDSTDVLDPASDDDAGEPIARGDSAEASAREAERRRRLERFLGSK